MTTIHMTYDGTDVHISETGICSQADDFVTWTANYDAGTTKMELRGYHTYTGSNSTNLAKVKIVKTCFPMFV